MLKTTIRQKLISYLVEADDDKINAIYILLEKEINEKISFSLNNGRSQVLDKDSSSPVSNYSKSYTREGNSLQVKAHDNLSPLLADILNKKYVIVSVIGPHAGKTVSEILADKMKEIRNKLQTYWLLRSPKAKTLSIQKFCKQAKEEEEDVYCLFINASTENGAKKTKNDTMVKDISDNNSDWTSITGDVEITGIISQHTTALVLSELIVFDEPIDLDLWNYSEFPDNTPIKFQLGVSTTIATRKSSIGMKSRSRKLVAWGRLNAPFAVWIR